MLLSVIVPVHNVSKTLRPCLTSILQQGVRDCEVILVDDGSTDGSGNLCDLLSAENDRIKTFHKPNGGLSAARNLGLDKAQGQFITFVDSDDLLCHDTYRPILTYLEAHPHVDIAEFPVIVHYGNPKKEYHLTFHGEVYETLADYWLQGRGYAHSYAWNKLYRASLFYQVRYPVGRSFEDILTLPHLLLQSRSIATLSTGCYLYRWNDRGITASATSSLKTCLMVTSAFSPKPVMLAFTLRLSMSPLTSTKRQDTCPIFRISPIWQLQNSLLNIFSVSSAYVSSTNSFTKYTAAHKLYPTSF